MKPKVSIITAYYNAEKYILESIKSIDKQIIDNNFVDVEYVLVNDHSTDKSESIVKDFIEGQHNENINYVMLTTPENLGCGGARRYGIDNSTGDYLMFLDADDFYINDDFVNRAVQDIISENADLVEYGLLMNYRNKSPREMVVSEKTILENDGENLVLELFKGQLIKFFIWVKIVTRKLAETYPYSRRRTYEDVETVPRWLNNAHKVVIMPSIEVNYRATANSIIRNNILKTRLGTINAMSDHFEFFKNNRNILKAIYRRARIDLTAVLNGKCNEDEGFNEMSRYNTHMLSFIYPDKYKDLTFNIDDDGVIV